MLDIVGVRSRVKTSIENNSGNICVHAIGVIFRHEIPIRECPWAGVLGAHVSHLRLCPWMHEFRVVFMEDFFVYD